MMVIPNNCKRLAEVDFPIVKVNQTGAREKGIKTGSVASIHVWWARRPLATCRAMNLACLIPDPADPSCPVDIRRSIALALDTRDNLIDITLAERDKEKFGSLSESRNSPPQLRKTVNIPQRCPV
mgnify:CR=1 FL=1